MALATAQGHSTGTIEPGSRKELPVTSAGGFTPADSSSWLSRAAIVVLTLLGVTALAAWSRRQTEGRVFTSRAGSSSAVVSSLYAAAQCNCSLVRSDCVDAANATTPPPAVTPTPSATAPVSAPAASPHPFPSAPADLPPQCHVTYAFWSPYIARALRFWQPGTVTTDMLNSSVRAGAARLQIIDGRVFMKRVSRAPASLMARRKRGEGWGLQQQQCVDADRVSDGSCEDAHGLVLNVLSVPVSTEPCPSLPKLLQHAASAWPPRPLALHGANHQDWPTMQ